MQAVSRWELPALERRNYVLSVARGMPKERQAFGPKQIRRFWRMKEKLAGHGYSAMYVRRIRWVSLQRDIGKRRDGRCGRFRRQVKTHGGVGRIRHRKFPSRGVRAKCWILWWNEAVQNLGGSAFTKIIRLRHIAIRAHHRISKHQRNPIACALSKG